MLDRTFYPLDPHFTSTLGLLTVLRVQLEFSKICRATELDAGNSGVGGGNVWVAQADSAEESRETKEDGGTSNVANPMAVAAAIVATTDDSIYNEPATRLRERSQ